jgi:hypothetical protein
MLWGKLLRSPIASGKIKRIDVGKALALRGVHAVVTGQECTGLKIGRRLYDMPILADGEVRFIGEKVAAVTADTELIAEEAVGLIDVEYEETEPILNPVETMKPGARLIHPDVVNYKGLPKPLKEPSNDFIYMTWGRATSKPGFARRISSSRTLYDLSGASKLYRASLLRRQGGCGRIGGILVVQQGSLWRARAGGQRAENSSGEIRFQPGLHRRRFRRQGRLHGSCRRVSFVQEGGQAGQAGDGLRRRIRRR